MVLKWRNIGRKEEKGNVQTNIFHNRFKKESN